MVKRIRKNNATKIFEIETSHHDGFRLPFCSHTGNISLFQNFRNEAYLSFFNSSLVKHVSLFLLNFKA